MCFSSEGCHKKIKIWLQGYWGSNAIPCLAAAFMRVSRSAEAILVPMFLMARGWDMAWLRIALPASS